MGYKHDFVEDNPYLVYSDDEQATYEAPADDDGNDDDQNNG